MLRKKLEERKRLLEEKRAYKKEEEKNNIVRLLNLPFDDEKIHHYNKLLYFATNGLMNQTLDENEIKLYILNANYKLFNVEEYDVYFSRLGGKKEEKSKYLKKRKGSEKK